MMVSALAILFCSIRKNEHFLAGCSQTVLGQLHCHCFVVRGCVLLQSCLSAINCKENIEKRRNYKKRKNYFRGKPPSCYH